MTPRGMGVGYNLTEAKPYLITSSFSLFRVPRLDHDHP
jgi:hypothetical protein